MCVQESVKCETDAVLFLASFSRSTITRRLSCCPSARLAYASDWSCTGSTSSTANGESALSRLRPSRLPPPLLSSLSFSLRACRVRAALIECPFSPPRVVPAFCCAPKDPCLRLRVRFAGGSLAGALFHDAPARGAPLGDARRVQRAPRRRLLWPVRAVFRPALARRGAQPRRACGRRGAVNRRCVPALFGVPLPPRFVAPTNFSPPPSPRFSFTLSLPSLLLVPCVISSCIILEDPISSPAVRISIIIPHSAHRRL